MKAKKEAKELLNEIDECVGGDISLSNAKDVAIMIVNKMMNTIPYENNTVKQANQRMFLIDVKSEINKL